MPTSGVIPSPPDERDYPVSAILPAVTLPKEVRLDNRILNIRDQGFWPTCVGKAGAAIMSAGFKEELATIPIYSRCKAMDGIPNLPGTYPRVAMKVMQHHGTCREKTLPYQLMSSPMPQLNQAVITESGKYKIKAYARARGINDIKQAAANGHLLMAVILVGDNFMFHRGNEVLGPPRGNTHGYHAIVLCGYDDDLKALRGANSWGLERWGDRGFFWLSYDVLMNTSHFPEAWVVEVEKVKTAEEFYPDRIFREANKKKLREVTK